MQYFAGIDIGSTAIKIVLIDENKGIIAYQASPTGSHFHKNTLAAFNLLLAAKNIRREGVSYIVLWHQTFLLAVVVAHPVLDVQGLVLVWRFSRL